ncbi:MAG: LysM peptidoglycan-binding domain-containing protein [Prevotella sp.]|nr:LysM peptidoglycan-binding domain-containing protein [Prevotella sp.]
MKRLFRYVTLIVVLAFLVNVVYGQTQKWREIHKVKKKETIFGIAREYGLTIQELIDANPEMNTPGYELKKDAYIYIPYAKGQEPQPSAPVQRPAPTFTQQQSQQDVQNRAIRLGIMLPLHDINGDGRRMVEYYRGVLMACDSLKKLGISVDVHAWNTPDDKDIAPVLREPAAQQCDLIIGPLYSKQMAQLSDFVTRHDIRLVIPFSINAPELLTNRNIFQIYQSPNNFNESVIEQFVRQFQGYHPVFIDCNDSTSQKGLFTSGLRRQLETRGIDYGLTNLKSSEANFAKSFSVSQPNVVILNTGRSPELNVAIAKLNGLKTTKPGLEITLFGYTDWLLYTKYQLDNFYKYNVYIPAAFHYNPLTSKTLRVEQKYRWNFHQDMMVAQPRFAITGFDHAMFFLQGFHRYGKDFTGAPGVLGYEPVQTPLKFERLGNGGLRNRSMVFVHYLPEHRVETISF